MTTHPQDWCRAKGQNASLQKAVEYWLNELYQMVRANLITIKEMPNVPQP